MLWPLVTFAVGLLLAFTGGMVADRALRLYTAAHPQDDLSGDGDRITRVQRAQPSFRFSPAFMLGGCLVAAVGLVWLLVALVLRLVG